MEPDERIRHMDADQFYRGGGGGKYLKGADIKGQEWEVTIKDALPDKDFNGHDAVAITFHEIEQQITLNKTNYLAVKENTGTSQTDGWIGKKIILYGTREDVKGEITDVVRIRMPEPKVRRVVPGKSKSPSYDERNPPPADPSDEIPF
jgi:hypothetical protein